MAQRLQIIDDLTADANRYFDVLVSLDAAIQSVSMSVEAFEEFATAESLWIPNKTLLKRGDIRLIPGMMSEISEQTPELFEESVYKSRHRVPITLFTILVVAVTLRLLRKKAAAARSVSLVDTRFFNLIGPFAYEVIVAALPAVILLGIAWILDAPDIESIMAYPIGNSLADLAIPMFFGVLLVRLCNADGIGRLQFGWPKAVCATIQRTFYRFVFPSYGLFFLSGVSGRLRIDYRTAHRKSICHPGGAGPDHRRAPLSFRLPARYFRAAEN